MPHQRPRLLHALLLRSLKHSPIVGILGQRQTGKTTLMESLAPSDAYVTLDQAAQLDAARGSPGDFLERGVRLFGIDECQLAPELFPALKEKVRKDKRPGQFLLTGSVRFTSRKLIRESLTGRIVSHELLPLCLAETHSFELGNAAQLVRLAPAALRARTQERLQLNSEARVAEHLERGGLPGICFFRNPTVRAERFNAHLDTILQRDLKLVFETTLPVEKIFKVLRYLALNQGNAFSMSDLGRVSRISAPSLQRLVPALEALFLIRRIGTLGDRKKDVFYLEDQGMATFLGAENDQLRILFSQCLAQLRYRHGPAALIQSYETRGGARVPLVLCTDGEMTGLVPVQLEAPDAKAIASAESFLKRYPKAVAAVLTQGKETLRLGKRLVALPYRSVL